MDSALRKKCLVLVKAAAKRHKVPPACVVAHVRWPGSDAARREVMIAMISRLGMKRWQVAQAFGRDLRRVRKSVLGV